MPGEEEIRRYQQEHPTNLAFRLMQATIPQIEFDPAVVRQKLAEEFRCRTAPLEKRTDAQ